MQRPHPILFGGFLVIVLGIFGAITLFPGALRIDSHEGDALHLMQIVLRMAGGQVPHIDFVTPIGALAVAPTAWLVQLGYGMGHAFMLSQLLIAIALVPMIWWAGRSRLTPGAGYLFGGAVLVFVLGLVYGGNETVISVSMHYNRWAWAIAFIALVLALLPAEREYPLVDGLFLGLLMAALAMIKVTYFAAFAPVAVIGLVLLGSWRTLLSALVAGLAIGAAITFWMGAEFWLAYVGDLLAVVGSDVRSQPTADFSTVVAGPVYLAGSLCGLLAVILLRQSDQANPGLLLLLLLPGFWYVTYQNFGNDPKWLLLLAVFLLMWRPPEGSTNSLNWNLRTVADMVVAVSVAISMPSFLNVAASPIRHLVLEPDDYTPLVPYADVHHDFQLVTRRAMRANATMALDAAGAPLAHLSLEPRENQTVWRGETLPSCQLEVGFTGWFDTVARQLEAGGVVDGQGIFTTDILGSLWLFGDFAPLNNGSPWYYGGLPGIEDAAYVLVPLCPIFGQIRKDILEAIEEADIELAEVQRTELYILYSRGQVPNSAPSIR